MGGVYIAVNEADFGFVVGVFEDCFDELVHWCNPRPTRNKTHRFMSKRQPHLRLGWEKNLFSSHLYLGMGPRMESCWPTFMSCKCELIGPLGYFFTIKSKVP